MYICTGYRICIQGWKPARRDPVRQTPVQDTCTHTSEAVKPNSHNSLNGALNGSHIPDIMTDARFNQNQLQLTIGQQSIWALVDTGASISVRVGSFLPHG